MSDLNFQPLLFGGDINVYSVARAFHEAYGVRSIAFGKYPSFPCHGSAILDYRVCPDNESADAFRRNVRAVAQEFPDKTVLLLGCGDSYVQLAAHCKDQLPDNVAAPYIDGALLDTLINKEKFYQLCDRYGIDHPATFIYDKSMGHDFTLPFDFIQVHFPGTGDVFSAVLIGELLAGTGLEQAARKAMDTVERLVCLDRNEVEKNKGIRIERFLKELDL